MPDAPRPPADPITRDMPMQHRAATLAPATADAGARTVEVVWSTGHRGLRHDWMTGRSYEEELSLDPAHVDLSRLAAGASVLDSHRQWDLDGVIGVVERAWIEAGEGRAVLRLSGRDTLAPLWADIEAGIVRHVSIGYYVRRYEVTEREGQVPLWRAVDWQPAEISFVPIPFDPGATTRSAPALQPCTITHAHPQETRMPDDPIPAAAPEQAAPPTLAAAPDQAAEVAAARAAEEARIRDIHAICHRAGMPAPAIAALIQGGQTVDQARTAAFDHLAARAGGDAIQSRVTLVDDYDAVHRQAMVDALLHRYDPGRYPFPDATRAAAARQYRGMTLLEMGAAMMGRRNISVAGLDRMERAGQMLGLSTRSGTVIGHGTGDFPYLLGDVASRTLRMAYEAAPQTWRPFVRVTSLSDFRAVSRVQLGDAPSLERVREHGTYTRGSISEAREQVQLATYGRVVALTRQAIVNDDLGAFTRLPELMGRAAADRVSDTVWSIITTNAAMSDGVALFHADHGNLSGSATTVTVGSLGAARAAMRQQTGLNGRLLNVQPSYIMVPAALETVVDQLLTSTTPTQPSEAVPAAFRSLTPIVEPRLDAHSTARWYLAASPGQIDTIEVAYLDGQEGVYLETRVGYDVDGLELKARLDVAAAAIDHRGLYAVGT